jgi:hypothetical protein
MLKNENFNALSQLGLLASRRKIAMAASNGNHDLWKKTQPFIEFPFIYLDRLKFFNLKYSFCRPLDSDAVGGRTTPSYAPASTKRVVRTELKTRYILSLYSCQ